MSTPSISPTSSSMNTQGQTLFNLLPALYRLRDAQIAQSMNLLTAAETAQLNALQALNPPLTTVQQQELNQLLAKAARGPLQSLIMLIEEQLAIVADDLNQLYDDLFIETCATWVIPYIGDLIGYQTINNIAQAVDSPRAEVANTISFRRRKGTVPVMEQLAVDATGWGAHAVELFQVLAWTQCIRNHMRPYNFYAPDLRRWEVREYMDSGFDKTAHTVDVRRIAVERGRYNIQNIGIFLWSLNAYSLTLSSAKVVAGNPQCFRFSTLGADIPLFNNPVALPPDTTTLAQPQNVPDRLRRRVLCKDIRDITLKNAAPVYYGTGLSLALYLDGSLQDPFKIGVCDLSGPDGSWINIPKTGGLIAIDPHLGRIALPPQPAGSAAPTVTASYYYGFNAEMGGGEYPREATFTASPEQAIVRVPGDYATIHDALAALPGDGVVEVTSSPLPNTNDVFNEPGGLNINVSANGHIELRAADGFRPTLVLGGEITVTGGTEGAFDLNGFVITYTPPESGASPPAALLYSPASSTNQLVHLGITHCTFVPGWALQSNGTPQTAYAGLPTVLVEASGLAVVVQNSILGGMWINGQATATLTNSIVDATDPTLVAYLAGFDSSTKRPLAGGALTLEGCTVIGKVYASLLSLVTDSILWSALTTTDEAGTPPLWSASLWAARQQQGCVRFSYLPAGAIVPRQFECVEQGSDQPAPIFYSLRYGDPAYAKLVPSTDPAIRQGADDGGEMGAFHFVLAPLREADLSIRMQEYMPVGLEFGIFYQN
jgi:hypothetical protein